MGVADPIRQRLEGDSASLSDIIGSVEVVVVHGDLVEVVVLLCPCCSCPELSRLRRETVVQHHGFDSLGQAADTPLQLVLVHMGELLARVLPADLQRM